MARIEERSSPLSRIMGASLPGYAIDLGDRAPDRAIQPLGRMIRAPIASVWNGERSGAAIAVPTVSAVGASSSCTAALRDSTIFGSAANTAAMLADRPQSPWWKESRSRPRSNRRMSTAAPTTRTARVMVPSRTPHQATAR